MSGQENGRRRACRIGLSIASLVIIAFSSMAAGAASPEELFSGVTTLIAPYSPHPAVNVDGRISVGEYDANVTFSTPDTDVSISLIHDNGSLFVGIEGPAWSWVALGISSDNAATMGFVVIAKMGSTYQAQERIVTNVSASMALMSVTGEPAIEDFEATATSNHTVAELRLSLDSHLWTLVPGVVYPTVFATNLTAPSGFPTVVSGADVHFMGSYLLRQIDSVKNVNDLLNGKTSIVPATVALILLVVGIGAIVAEFVVRGRKP